MKQTMKIRLKPLVALTAVVLCSPFALASDALVDRETPALLPLAQKAEWADKALKLDAVAVSFPDNFGKTERSAFLKQDLRSILKDNGVKVSSKAKKRLKLRLGKVDTPNQWEGQEKEAYKLTVEGRGITITANTETGLFYGVQTLRQLIVNKNKVASVAVCDITDYPAFKIRGFMHDIGRNFQSIEQLKMQVDVMAKHKFNIFHFHCTEYHGWRLESKIYPKLQAKSSFTRKPGKYYTQEEFVDFVNYCWERNITVIPEFDSPGHSDAFMKGVGVDNMKDPKALKAITELIHELCSLVPKEKMPYVHVGTDEVRSPKHYVNADYLPALHKAVQDNGREVIGWSQGMTFKGAKQISQTWAKSNPFGGTKHIDSRSNYVNHLDALDFAQRMFFQQPCRQPFGDEVQMGGILCLWPDTKVDDEKLILTNNPAIPAMVAYSEAVWKGVKEDRYEFWSKMPQKGTEEHKAYADFEDRIAEMRDRFHSNVPFPMVKSYDTEWRLLGPVEDKAVKELEKGIVKESYDQDGAKFNWTQSPAYGGTVHVKHFFGFPAHMKSFPKGKNVVWANTHLYSPKDQTVDAWIGFNTISSSDPRAGAPKQGDWSKNPLCAIWVNGEKVNPPRWKTKGNAAKETALIDEVYASREPSKIKLKKGWNTVLMKTSPSWKWVFTFAPVEKNGQAYKEVEGLKFSATLPTK